MRPSRPPQAGFTLFEMLVVLAVIGLVTGLLGFQRPVRSARLELEDAARALAGTLQSARARAIAENRSIAVTIGPAAYASDGGAPRPLPARVVAAEAGSILFAADGSALGGGVTLQAEGQALRVSVAWLTGRVSSGVPR